jgi:hypothetical protein
MANFNNQDIFLELVELLAELIKETQQELVYYRASVYKTESAKSIDQNICQLKIISEVIGDESLFDLFGDYEATTRCGNVNVSPGECTFSSRVARLLLELENQLNAALENNNSGIRLKVKQHKKKLMTICRKRPRHLSLFQRS